MTKKSTFKRIAVLALMTLMALSFVFQGCGKDDTSKEPLTLKYFAMPSTVKVLRDEDYSSNYVSNPKLVIESACNEYESTQLIFNPSRDVDSYTVEVTDLTCGDNVIYKDNIDVYFQHYVEVKRSSTPSANFPLGFYPDAIIPMESSIEAGENTVQKGKNQGVWITSFVPKDTPKGTYTGSVKLIADQVEKTFPLSLTVWGFNVSDESHLKTVFTTTQEWLIGGELDNTEEKYWDYINGLTEYRISTIDVPGKEDLDTYIQNVKTFAADPKFSAYQVYLSYTYLDKENYPKKPNGESYGVENSDIDYKLVHFDEDIFEDYITALIENSTPQLNLLEKAILYVGGLDEAHAFGKQENCKYFSMRLTDLLIVISDKYSDEQLQTYGLTKGDIIGLDMIFTIPYYSEAEGLRGFCPLISEYDTQSQRDKYYESQNNVYAGYNGAAAGYGNLWTYFCNDPHEPYTTDHIDAGLVGSRIMSWFSYDYGFDGILNWGTSVYADVGTGNSSRDFYENRDAYNDCEVFWAGQGDGGLCYPGAKYGLDSFVPSIRLMSLRDGFEDYEWLYALDNVTAQLVAEYGVADYDLSSNLKNVFETLYNGTVYNPDYNNVLEARRQLAGLLELINCDAKAIVNVKSVDAVTKKAVIEVYAASGTTLTVGGQQLSSTVSGNGVKFTYELALNNPTNSFVATITNGEDSLQINRFVSTEVNSIDDFNGDDVSKWYAVKDGDNENIRITGANGQMVVSVDRNTSSNLFYKPAFNITVANAMGSENLSVAEKLCFEAYNDSGRDIEISVILVHGNGKPYKVKSITLKQGKNVVEVDGLSELDVNGGLSAITEISVQFENSKDGETNVKIDNVYYCRKAG